jgi:hypothetical protein
MRTACDPMPSALLKLTGPPAAALKAEADLTSDFAGVNGTAWESSGPAASHRAIRLRRVIAHPLAGKAAVKHSPGGIKCRGYLEPQEPGICMALIVRVP